MKKELVEKMTEYVKRKTKEHPTGKVIGINERQVIAFCAECASEHYGDKWTRVEDGLPENDLPHLVATDCSGRSYTNRYPHRYVDGEWHCDGDPNVTWFIVTHWQPLPEDPQQ